jgi:threonine dehydrogenase-like Zn-dependent dehydrogenase
MRAAIFHGGRDIRLEELPLPVLRNDDVLIEVRAAGICGSDVHRYRGHDPWGAGGPPPRRAGHELAGVVSALGPGASGLAVGQPVAVEPMQLAYCGFCPECSRGDSNLCSQRGKSVTRRSSAGFSEFDAAAARHVYPLAPHVSFAVAALTDVYACAVHALHRVPVAAGKTVAILGTGPVALALGQIARREGAKVIMVGRRDAALSLALRIGSAESVVDGSREQPAAECADIVFEVVGGTSSDTLMQAVASVARGGTVGILGAFVDHMHVPYRESNRKEITFRLCNGYSTWQGQREFQIALDLIAEPTLDAASLITHRFPLENIALAFETAGDKSRSHAVKVIVEPHA